MSGTLYTFPNSFRSNKILVAAEYSGHKVTVDPAFVVGETDKSEAFLKKFPFGKVPAYESGDIRLFETNAIAYYVGNAQTRGADKEAEVLQWISFADNVVQPAACTWVYPTMGIMQFNKQNTEKAKSDLKAALATLNTYLSTRTFLVGERVTQADITLACTLCMLYEHVMEPAFRDAYGNVNRWFVTLVNQPEFKSVLGEVKLCSKMAQFDKKKFDEIHGKAGGKKGGEDKKGKGQQTGAGDSKPKPKSEPKAEEQPAQTKPKKDPWAGLPETTFDMDAFKREYSNDKSTGHLQSIKYFWEHFDKEKYSLWTSTYKFPEEFALGFMAGNLVEGMHQRIEGTRKHCMAWQQIYGRDKKPKYRLTGLWFWRGQDLLFLRNESWQVDYESFDWRKLDPGSDEAKKMVEFYFNGPETDGEYEIKDTKVFK